MGEGLHIAHHIGALRPLRIKAHRPEATVIGKMHRKMHGTRSRARDRRAGIHTCRTRARCQALRQRLARLPRRRNRNAAIARLLEGFRLCEIGDRQRHAVLAHAVEARGGRTIAIVVDYAGLEIGEHDINVEVIGNARGRRHPTGDHRHVIAAPNAPIHDRCGIGGNAHTPRHGAWVSVFSQLDTAQTHRASFSQLPNAKS